jgi:hypothetical protein
MLIDVDLLPVPDIFLVSKHKVFAEPTASDLAGVPHLVLLLRAIEDTAFELQEKFKRTGSQHYLDKAIQPKAMHCENFNCSI